MPWLRIDDRAMNHPKIAGLPDGAFRLWVEGLAYCQTFLTDGVIPVTAFKGLRAFSPKRRDVLLAAGLWDAADSGVTVHDYLQWNESKEVVLANRDSGKRRVALLRDAGLRQSIRDRDGDDCRYCGRTVEWKDRKGDRGGTYDHVDPCVGNTLENLVVCCRGCNSSKGRRTPEQAGMILRESKKGSRSDLSRSLLPTGGGEGYSPQQTLELARSGKGSLREKPDGKNGQILFRSTRFVVFRWMFEELAAMLGPHTDGFRLDEWFYTLAERADQSGLVIPGDSWKWLQAQTLAEAQRRGLPIASADDAKPQKSKLTLALEKASGGW